MTHPTKSVYKLLLQDFVKVSAVSEADTLFTEHDVLASMDRITPVNFHEAVHHQGIQFWAYNAGHVLGGAMFLIEIAGVKVGEKILCGLGNTATCLGWHCCPLLWFACRLERHSAAFCILMMVCCCWFGYHHCRCDITTG